LEELSFIAGNKMTLNFKVYDDDGLPVDLTNGFTMQWKLFRYGRSEDTVVIKSGTLGVEVNEWYVTIETSDTQNLYGKFIQQPIVIDYEGSQFSNRQGIVTIISKAS
jgi:hypothetical protein